MKRLILSCCILFLTVFCFVGCERDSIESEKEISTQTIVKEVAVEIISNDHIYEKDKHLTELLEDLKSKISTKGFASKRGTAEDFNIDENRVIYISKGDYKSFTFRILPTGDTSEIKNLLFSLQKDGSYKAFIISYNLSTEEKEQLLRGKSVDLSDKASYEMIDLEAPDFLTTYQSRGGKCYKLVQEISRGTGWEIYVLKEVSCSGGGGGSSTGTWGDSSSGTDWHTDNPFEGNDNQTGGGGASNSGNTSNSRNCIACGDDLTTFTLMYEAQSTIKTKLLIDNGSPEGIWLNTKATHAQLATIYNFLVENNFSTQAKRFTKEVIKAYESGNYTGLYNHPIFNQPDPYDVWKDLTEEEKDLIKSFPMEAYNIFMNRSIAEEATIQEFQGNGLNDKSDAFRHAFFNALNTYSVGAYMAKLFSDAHESEVPNQLNLEKQMDLFNNSVGHGAQINYPNLSEEALKDQIMLELTNGNLRYLSPLDFNSSPIYDLNGDDVQDCPHCLNGIIQSTKLIPTNQ